MKRVNESLFRAICLAFSAILLVLFLLTGIDLAAERDKQTRLLRETEELSAENDRLRAQTEERLSLEAIERYAREELGMQPIGSGQLVYLDGDIEE